MKDKYTGDIGDYAKIILLNELATVEKVNLGVNWYYNNREYGYEKKQLDGKHIDYLKSDKKGISFYEPNLYQKLIDITENNARKVDSLFGLIKIDSNQHFKIDVPYKNRRKQWVNDSIEKLHSSNLIFLDPDNGICYNDKGGKVKHVLQSEIIDMYNSNKSLVIYNHRDRKTNTEYFDKFKAIAYKLNPKPNSVYILRASLNSVRDYVFYLHNSIQKEVEDKLHEIVKVYPKLFTLQHLNL